MYLAGRTGIALATAASLLLGVRCGGGNEAKRENARVLTALRADAAKGLVPPTSTVLEEGELTACAAGSRSDGWAEVTWSFSTGVGPGEVIAFFRSELPQRGWAEDDAAAYDEGVTLFRKSERQLRLYVRARGDRHLAILEAPPNRPC